MERGSGVVARRHHLHGETYKNVVKMTFASNTRRAIDIHEGERVDEEALKALIRAAVALNTSK
ncbi:hypothetical protein PMI36_06094 [Pseudomonas sp. GM79]|nr:hypothetical protein PMI36_06094 [Pseudomonas sp. GM79]